MRKILFIINTMGRAGAEKSLIALLKTIDYTRCSVSLLSIVNRGELFADIPAEVTILNKKPDCRPVLGIGGAWYIAVNTLWRMLRSGYIFKFIPYAFKMLFSQIKNKQLQMDKLLWLPMARTAPVMDETYDMAIAFIEGASTYYLAERVKAKKKVAFIHVHYQKAGYKKEYDAPFYAKTDYICCISRSVLDVFRHVYPEYADRLRLFPNIIDAAEIRAAAQKQEGFSDAFDGLRIVTVGRLHPQKGYDVAIPAFAKLVGEGYENIRWYILGDGTEKSKLEKLIHKYNLKDKFILLGSRENPYPFMMQCDFYVQPSRFEGFPLTLQEALILQKPCVTANFEGISGLLINGKNAVIIELSEDSLYNAIKKMACDTGLRDRITAATRDIDFAFSNEIDRLYYVMDGKEWGESVC